MSAAAAAAAADECSLCLEGLHHQQGEGTLGAAIPCGHVFHESCFQKLREHHQNDDLSCPNCKKRTSSFQKLFIDLSTLAPTRRENTARGRFYSEEYDDVTSAIGDRHGCFVFQALKDVSVRRGLKNNSETADLVFKKNELVSVDCIRESRVDKILRLSDREGWLFEFDEKKKDERSMKQVQVTDGLWTYYADNHPNGINLRRHPNDRRDNIVNPKRNFLPMEKIVCDKHVTGADGTTNFYRVQGTDGWVFDKRGDRFMMIPDSKVRKGLFVYRSMKAHAVRVRKSPDVEEESHSTAAAVVGKNELIAVDVVRESPRHNTGNGPFLRLTDGSGWMFENKRSDPFMEEVNVEEGSWSFCVLNAPAGIDLRRQPIDSDSFNAIPRRLFSPGEVVDCDRKVQSANNGVNAYRVKGTEGWVFDKRGGKWMLELVSRSVSSSRTTSPDNWSAECVRRIASSVDGVVELAYNPHNLVISFKTSRGVLVNVYYMTRTVGAACDHPTQWKFQLFHHDCSPEDLRQIFQNPWVHTGNGCQAKARLSDTTPASLSNNNTPAEEHALRESLKAFDSERAVVESRRSQALLQVKSFDKKQASDEALYQSKTDKVQDELKRLKKKEEKEKAERLRLAAQVEKKKKEEAEKAERLRLAELERKKKKKERENAEELARTRMELLEKLKRGDRLTSFTFHSDQITLDADAQLYAMGGQNTVLLTRTNGWKYTSGLPTGIHLRLNTIGPSDSQPMYVSLGSNGRYYMTFSNGKSEWSDGMIQRFNDIVTHTQACCVAFGQLWDSFVVLTHSGYYYNNVPLQVADAIQNNGHKPIHSVSLGPSGEYFVAWKDGTFTGGSASERLNNEVRNLTHSGLHVRDIKFGDDFTYIIRYSSYHGPF